MYSAAMRSGFIANPSQSSWIYITSESWCHNEEHSCLRWLLFHHCSHLGHSKLIKPWLKVESTTLSLLNPSINYWMNLTEALPIDVSAIAAPHHGVGGSKAFKCSPVNVTFIPTCTISAPTSGLCRVTQQPGGTITLLIFTQPSICNSSWAQENSLHPHYTLKK